MISESLVKTPSTPIFIIIPTNSPCGVSSPSASIIPPIITIITPPLFFPMSIITPSTISRRGSGLSKGIISTIKRLSRLVIRSIALITFTKRWWWLRKLFLLHVKLAA